MPLVVRTIVGRVWRKCPQHSQNMRAMFAHVPGLKGVTPALPADVKGLLVSSVRNDDPLLFIVHRRLHDTFGDVPEALHEAPLGKVAVVRPSSL